MNEQDSKSKIENDIDKDFDPYTDNNLYNPNIWKNPVKNPVKNTYQYPIFTEKENKSRNEFLNIIIELVKNNGSVINLPKSEIVWKLLKELLNKDDLLALIKKEPDWLEFI